MRRHWRYHHGTVSWIGRPSSILRQWFCKEPDRTRGLLRPPLRHAPYGPGEGGPRELPESPMKRLSPVTRVLVVAILGTSLVHAQNLSFVTCPIVRDTKTVPCWLAEYNGEIYYLGNQGGVAQDFYPPQLNHEVLVEGTIAEGPRVCGGVPLRPVKTSVFLEINRACNTILPVEDGIEAPARAPARDPVSWVRSDGPSDTTLYFDFDNDFLSCLLYTS